MGRRILAWAGRHRALSGAIIGTGVLLLIAAIDPSIITRAISGAMDKLFGLVAVLLNAIFSGLGDAFRRNQGFLAQLFELAIIIWVLRLMIKSFFKKGGKGK